MAITKQKTCSGDITLFIIGTFEGLQPVGPFWDNEMSLPEKGITSYAKRLLKFGKEAQKELEMHSEEWVVSSQNSEKYLSTHRKCARRVGKVLEVDMEDHDLTKTRIVQIALGYMWHWAGDKSLRSETLMELASDAIKAGHL